MPTLQSTRNSEERKKKSPALRVEAGVRGSAWEDRHLLPRFLSLVFCDGLIAHLRD
jgi:hypothetical protein